MATFSFIIPGTSLTYWPPSNPPQGPAMARRRGDQTCPTGDNGGKAPGTQTWSDKFSGKSLLLPSLLPPRLCLPGLHDAHRDDSPAEAPSLPLPLPARPVPCLPGKRNSWARTGLKGGRAHAARPGPPQWRCSKDARQIWSLGICMQTVFLEKFYNKPKSLMSC